MLHPSSELKHGDEAEEVLCPPSPDKALDVITNRKLRIAGVQMLICDAV